MNILKIPNQIITAPLQKINLSKIDSLAVHHMAHPTADIKTVEGWHIDQGWRALGYNFWVGFDGSVYEGRGFHQGSGVANHNHHIISIGFQGDYHSKPIDMPNEQFNAGVDIIKYVLEKVPTIKTIGGHGDYMATACPGRYFPLEEMKTLVKRGEPEMEILYYDWTTACPEWSQPYVQKALDLKILKGDSEGRLRLTDDRIWSLVITLRAHGIME